MTPACMYTYVVIEGPLCLGSSAALRLIRIHGDICQILFEMPPSVAVYESCDISVAARTIIGTEQSLVKISRISVQQMLPLPVISRSIPSRTWPGTDGLA